MGSDRIQYILCVDLKGRQEKQEQEEEEQSSPYLYIAACMPLGYKLITKTPSNTYLIPSAMV